MDPYPEERRTGRGVHGKGSVYLSQNQIVVKAQLARGVLDRFAANSDHPSLYMKAIDPAFYQVFVEDWVVTENFRDPRAAPGNPRRPGVFSVFNGAGAPEVARSKGNRDIAKADLMSRFRPMGKAYDGLSYHNLKDVKKQESVGVVVGGTVTDMARRDMYAGAIVCLRLPDPGEVVKRQATDDAGSIKLIPDILTAESTYRSVSAAMKRYIYALKDPLESRFDRTLRRIEPGRNLYESFANASVVHGLTFLKALIDAGVVEIAHPAGAPEHFSLQDRGAAGLAGVPLLIALAKAFGLVPANVAVPGVMLNRDRYTGFDRLRRLITAMAWYDGESRDHAFHSGVDVAPWQTTQASQTPAQRVTQAQINAPRDVVSGLEDLLHERYKWVVGTCIQGAPRDSPFRTHLKSGW